VARRTSGPAKATRCLHRSGPEALAAPLVEALLHNAPGSELAETDGESSAVEEPSTQEPGPLLPEKEPVDLRFTHGFHTWPAALPPWSVITTLPLLPPGPVADPFCGGGTVLVEAMVAGRTVIGRDLSAVAVRVARARTTLASPELLTSFRSACRKAAEEARVAPIPADPERARILAHWYEPHVLMEMETLRRATMKAPQDIRPLMVACLSSMVVKTSFRASDTVARREERHRPPGTTAVLFHKRARELARRLEAFRQAVPESTPPADLAEGDARLFHSPLPLAGILTSPPYPGVYDYLPMQQLRHVWLGIDTQAAMDREMGSRRAFSVDFERARAGWRKDGVAWMTRAFDALEPEGRLVVFLGDGRSGHRILGTAEPTMAMATESGFRVLAWATVIRPDPRWGGQRLEHAFLFEKDARR
jgi:hypothetical protein